MITLWRLVKRKHRAEAFSGDGARIAGGRWNLPGTRVVYLSGSLSLAALELFVHLPRAARSIELVSFQVEVPGEVEVETLPQGELPKVWREEPVPEETQRMGDEWVNRGETLLLRVPSVLVPHESNYLLNPTHRDFGALKMTEAQTFSFDPRMWK